RSYGDWSSDVCSSDLGQRARAGDRRPPAAVGSADGEPAGGAGSTGCLPQVDGTAFAGPLQPDAQERLDAWLAAAHRRHARGAGRSEEHTSELQSPYDL